MMSVDKMTENVEVDELFVVEMLVCEMPIDEMTCCPLSYFSTFQTFERSIRRCTTYQRKYSYVLMMPYNTWFNVTKRSTDEIYVLSF